MIVGGCKGIAHEFQRPEGSTLVGYEYIPSVAPSNVVDGTVCKCGEARWLSEREMPIPRRHVFGGIMIGL